ncbi:MAG: hypothetical protein ABI443_04030 [Chthoniobacterales bacterium]
MNNQTSKIVFLLVVIALLIGVVAVIYQNTSEGKPLPPSMTKISMPPPPALLPGEPQVVIDKKYDERLQAAVDALNANRGKIETDPDRGKESLKRINELAAARFARDIAFAEARKKAREAAGK